MTDFQLRRLLEMAWVAGIIDGEGCIAITKDDRRGTYGAKLIVKMTHEATINKLYKLFGTGIIQHKPEDIKTNRKAQWIWETSSLSEILFVIGSIHQFLVTKKLQANLVLDFGPIWIKGSKANGHRKAVRSQEESELLELMYQQSRTLNVRGV